MPGKENEKNVKTAKNEDTKVIHKLGVERKAELEEQYGKHRLRILEVPMDEVGHEFLEVAAIVPPRDVTGQLIKYSETNPKKAADIAIRNCLLTHKEQIEKDDTLFFSVSFMIMELMPIRQGRIKNF
ncbi:MAG: hypothetical protein JXR60_12255 [Bacteroidales bacterium]|nr:hypothetical protein [Bacteroidales bacterium]